MLLGLTILTPKHCSFPPLSCCLEQIQSHNNMPFMCFILLRKERILFIPRKRIAITIYLFGLECRMLNAREKSGCQIHQRFEDKHLFPV